MSERHESQRTDMFEAEGSDGRKYRVSEYTSFTITRYLDGTSGRLPGLKSYRLDDGRSVNLHDDGSMTIVSTVVKLRRV